MTHWVGAPHNGKKEGLTAALSYYQTHKDEIELDLASEEAYMRDWHESTKVTHGR